MESFHITVLAIATIIFIIALTTIGMLIQKGSKSGTFPPTASNCPDDWAETSAPSGDTIIYTCAKPVGVTFIPSNGLTSDSSGNMIYNDSTTSICDKRTWTTTNNINWDGVSNYNNC